MNSTMHTVAIAVLAAIIGGVGGAALTNSRNASADAEKVSAQTVPAPDTAPPALTQEQIDQIAQVAAEAATESLRMQTEANAYQTSATARPRGRSSTRRVYYDYAAPRPAVAYTTQNQGSFWQRHRDILTVAIGTGIGAAIGAGTGGKKGALIGAGVGAGGSALYTYALRNRNNGY